MGAMVKSLISGRRSLIVTMVLILAAGGIAFWILRVRADAAEYITEPVERGSIRNVVNATGTVQALLTVLVGSQVSGQVESLHADFNSVVQRGQLLAKLDARRYQAAVIEAQANLQASQARVHTTEADLLSVIANRASSQANVEAARVAMENAAQILRRYEQLQQDGILSQNDYDTAKANSDSAAAKHNQAKAQLEQVEAQINASRAQLEQAKAQVQQAEANLKQAQVDLEYTTITSPVDGVVISRNVDVGQTVAASLAAPTLFVIANDLTKMQVNASIDEADVGSITDAEAVQFTVDAYPNRSYTGRIAEVRLEPSSVQNVTTYSVIIYVDNDRLELKPGMTANISITVAEQVNVLKIPNAAMRYLPPGVTREEVAEMTRKAGPPGPVTSLWSDPAGAALKPEVTIESDALAMPSPPEGGAQASRGELRRSGEEAAARQDNDGQSQQSPGVQSVNAGPSGFEGEGRIGQEHAGLRTGSASQTLETELAPGQMWDPTAKIQFPRQQKRSARPGIVWVLSEQSKPEPRLVFLGITDGISTEIVSGELQESDAVIVGDSTQAAAAAPQTQSRGFGGGPPGGGRIFFGGGH
ncbi:MAG: efflux RND transporter periplasmic adaptor subunit [Acidobacteria bacterium]|nr:efflux RND transporter periplasmic adaptor subunit [Acidobacteriota bacterium]